MEGLFMIIYQNLIKMDEVWKKVMRLFLIISGVILILFFIGMFSFNGGDDERNIENSQKFKVTVSHESTEYVFYCQEYMYNPGLIILIDWKGNTTNEIIVTESMYVRTGINPDYDLLLLMEKFKEDIEKLKKEEEVEVKKVKKQA